MKMNANKFIAGLGKQYFIHPDHVGEQGGAEKYIPGLGLQILINPYDIDEEGGAEKYLPGLGKDYFVNPEHLQKTVTVTFEGEIEGAVTEVRFGFGVVKAEEDGSYELIEGTHSYIVSEEGVGVAIGKIEVKDEDIAIEVVLE